MRRKPHVLLLVPLLMAVVLIALSIPVTCAMAGPQQGGGGCGPMSAPGPRTSMPLHTGQPKPMPSQGGNHVCPHFTAATTALSPDNLRLLGTMLVSVALVLLAAPAAAPRVAHLARVVIEPSPPPGIVLTAAHLRV